MNKNKDFKQLEKKISTNSLLNIALEEDDRDYQIATIIKDLPDTYLLEGMKILNQGDIGSCVAHSIATAIGYGEIKAGLKEGNDYSRGFIYGNRRLTDWQWEGMVPRQALKQINKIGCVEYKSFPYNEKYQEVKKRIEKDKENLYKLAETHKIKSYFRCHTVQEIKTALYNQGAVILSAPIYDNFCGELELPTAANKSYGWHEMCLVGWDETGWIVQNSWGKSWGNKGLLHMPFDYPVFEWWGIVVNDNIQEPKKSNIINFFIHFFNFLKNWLGKIFRKGKK